MFEKIRKPNKVKSTAYVKKIFSYIIFGLICLVFVFLSPFGGQTGGFGQGVVAHVGRETIRSQEFRFLEENMRAQQKTQINQSSPEEARRIENNIKKRVLSHLVNSYLILQGARKEGFRISDYEVQDAIQSIPVFREKDRFIYSRYRNFLKNQNLSSSRFENRIRREIFSQRWNSLFFQAVPVSFLENEKRKLQESYQASIRFVEIKLEQVPLSQLEAALKKQARSEVENLIKKAGVSWIKPKPFSVVSGFVLELRQNKKVIDSIIDYLPRKGLIPQLISENAKVYVVDVLNFKKLKKSKPKQARLDMSLLLGFEKPSRTADSWIKEQEQNFEVNVNEILFVAE